MVEPDLLFGRFGNRLFQMAKLYAVSKEENTDWYFQDPKHFEKYKDDIKKLFGEGIGYLPYVAIHLRRGKNPINPNEPAYSENPFYVNLAETHYYADAFAHFPNRKFLVFSDDMEFAKKYFDGGVFGFDDSETDLEAFNKFASCESHIIANSSWSWWGAYLSPEHPGVEKKVIAPSVDNWFSDKIERTRCPNDWIRL